MSTLTAAACFSGWPACETDGDARVHDDHYIITRPVGRPVNIRVRLLTTDRLLSPRKATTLDAGVKISSRTAVAQPQNIIKTRLRRTGIFTDVKMEDKLFSTPRGPQKT